MTTIGQRIALLRKESGLSQEAFGESLNVSRQAISKWESDASIPDVDNLVAISKKYNVSIGWILCAEEDRQRAAEDSLTEQQLKIVREIVRRYIEAMPKPKTEIRWEERPKKKTTWKTWLKAIFALAAVIAVIVAFRSEKKRYTVLADELDYLNYRMNDIHRQLTEQEAGITGRMEDILKTQNPLLADYSAEITSADLSSGTVTIEVSAVPRSRTEGMTVYFTAKSGGETVRADSAEAENHTYSATLTCPHTDDITISALLQTGDVTETQVIETFENEKLASAVALRGNAQMIYGRTLDELEEGRWDTYQGKAIPLYEQVHLYTLDYPLDYHGATVELEKLELRVAVNGNPVRVSPFGKVSSHTDEEGAWHTGFDLDFPLAEGDRIDYMVYVTDNFGRQWHFTLESFRVANSTVTIEQADASIVFD